MIEHLKFFSVGAVALVVFFGVLMFVGMLAWHFSYMFFALIGCVMAYYIGQKVVADYRDTVKTYGKDWWKN